MSDLLLPGYTQIRLDGQPKGAAYDEMAHPKLGWHTWEGLSWAAAESAFRPYPPHLGVFPPWPGKERQVGRRQYVPLNRHAYAFAGSESDDEFVIQVEVAGFAASMRDAPDVVREWLALEVVAPLEKAVGVPRTVIAFGFHDTRSYHGRYPLASKRSSIRLTAAELRKFSGHLGHQHMPGDDDPTDHDDSGDEHWDPGALPIDWILNFLNDHDNDRGDFVAMAAFDRLDAQKGTVRSGLRTMLLRADPADDEVDVHVLFLAQHGYEAWVRMVTQSTEGKAVLNRERTAAGLRG